MNRLLAFAATLGDRANPVVVKELRQAVQSRLVGSIVMLFLLVNLVTVGGFLMFNDSSSLSATAGRELFFALYCILVVTCMVFVPLYAAIRLAMERNDANIDLLFVTTISSAKIVRGKFFAAVALAVLIYSSCLPFLVLTYLLRGIDLPSIFVALGASLAFTVGVIMVAIFAGSISGGWLLRFLIGGALLLGMYGAVAGTIVFGYELVQWGLAYYLNGPEMPYVITTCALAYLTAWGLFFLLAVAALSAKSSNRMMPLRLFLTFAWIAIGTFMAIWSWVVGQREWILVWSLVSTGLFSALLAFTFAERESWTPRVRRHIPRGTPQRFLAWLAFTGSAGGALWCLMIIGISLAVGWMTWFQWEWFPSGPYAYHPSREFEYSLYIMTGIFLFTWNYSMSGLLARRIFLPHTLPLVGPLLSIGILLLGCILPLLAAWLIQGDRWSVQSMPIVLLLPHPAVLDVGHASHWLVVFTFLIAWAVLGLIVNLPWFVQQWQLFVRHERRKTQPAAAAPTVTHHV